MLFALARKHDLLRVAPSEEIFRWGLVASLLPALIFLVSIPVAFVAPLLGMLTWALGVPVGMITGRRMPEQATEYFEE